MVNYILSKKIEKVNPRYRICGSQLLYISNEELFLGSKKIAKNVQDSPLDCCEGEPYFFDGESTLGCGNVFNGAVIPDSIHKHECLIASNHIFNEQGKVIHDLNLINGKSEEVIYDFGKVLIAKSVSRNGKFIFFNYKTEIKCFDRESLTFIWEFKLNEIQISDIDFPEEIVIVRQLMHKEYLILCLSHNFLFVLDISTGTIVKIFKEELDDLLEEYQKTDSKSSLTSDFIIKPSSNSLILFYGRKYIEINLLGFEIIVTDLRDKLKNKNITSLISGLKKESFNSQIVYLKADMDGSKFGLENIIPQCIVAFDLNQKTILWVYRFIDDSVHSNPVLYADNRIYVRGFSGNLYIFSDQQNQL